MGWTIAAFLLAGATSSPADELAPGVAVERALGPGDVHSFSLLADLPASDAPFGLVAEQLGVDLALVRLAADGSEIVRVDSPTGRRGAERLLLEPATTPGERIEVRALERRAPTGRYRLVLMPPPAVADLRRLAAEREVFRADRAYARGDAQSRQEALAAQRAALALWRELGDRREEARALRAIGLFQRLSGDAAGAIASYDGALALWRALGDTVETAWVLNDLGFARAQSGDGAGANVAYDEALALWESLDDGAGLGRTLNNKGLVLHTAGDPRSARPFYERALPLLEAAGYPALAATVVNNLAAVFDSLGEPDAAAAAYERAIATQHELGNRREEARALGNRATLLRTLGRLQDALDGYRRALEIQRELGDPAETARTLSNLGETYLTLGEPERALELVDESLALRRQGGDRRGEAYSLHNLGAVERARGELAAARTSFMAAVEGFRAASDKRGEANSLRTLGEALATAGEREAARSRFGEALALQAELGDRRGRGETLRRRGELELAAGGAEAAAEDFATARELARETRHPLAEVEALVGLARAERARGRATEAEARIGEALVVIEKLRAGVATPELRATFVALRAGAVELAVDLAWDAHRREPTAGHDRRAFELAQGARARGLAEGIAESAERSSLAPELAARRRTAAERLSLKTLRLGDRLARGQSGAEVETLEREAAEALAELEATDAEIDRALPRLATWSGPRAATVAEVQALLEPGTLLLVYALGTERSRLFALESGSFTSHELPPAAGLEAAARELHERWRSFEAGAPRGADREAATALAGRLLGPVATALATARRLAVIPDGALGLVPFAALPEPGGAMALVEHREVAVVPSAHVLAALRARRASRPATGENRDVLIVADPVFDRRDPRVPAVSVATGESPAVANRLAWSGAEAAAVAREWPAARVRQVVGFDADVAVLTAQPLDRYRVIHLATHGLVDTARSERTGLLFSGLDAAGHGRPGFLGLPEIHGLVLSADLVVLSGCRTALGRELRNEGPIGLARGFLYAGSAAVVASLWPVEDRATAELMSRFYRALASGEPGPAAALAAAQRSLRSVPRWSDPYYWSGFVLYGDGR